MHLIIIIAFAALLWFNSTTPMNLLKLSPWTSLVVVLVQVAVLVTVSLVTTRRTIRVLREHPADPNEAQHVHHVYSIVLHVLVLGFFLSSLILTGWPQFVNDTLELKGVVGLADALVLTPFILSILLMWIVQYPADRAIRELAINPRIAGAHPVHPVWTLGQYLGFNLRHQLLTVALPMMFIIIADDLRDVYKDQLRATTGLFWMPDALLGLVICAVFLFAPVILRYTWTTRPLPKGELREALERLAQRLQLKYSQILVWHSRGMVVNAAVMGLVGPVRYVLITDGLLESMTDRQIAAVFGHEAGHIKHWHIPYFILFATLTMLIAGGLMLLLYAFAGDLLSVQHVQLIVGAAVVALWAFAFGWLSHQFEYQADMAGALSISDESSEQSTQDERLISRYAAEEFGQALKRVAVLNGIPTEDRGWRHPSINDRVEFLKQASEDPRHRRRFMHRLRLAKVVLIGGTLVGLAIAAYVYRYQLLPAGWLN